MKYYTKCSNYASDTCPCELAEEGKCIVCSMNRGEATCDCTDTVSYCIEQELINNGGKAKAHRPDIEGKITYVREFRDELKFIRFVVPDITPFMNRDVGTYVFMRLNSSTFYDVPLSVTYDDINDVKLIRSGSFVGACGNYEIQKRLYSKPSQMVCVVDDKGIKAFYPVILK